MLPLVQENDEYKNACIGYLTIIDGAGIKSVIEKGVTEKPVVDRQTIAKSADRILQEIIGDAKDVKGMDILGFVARSPLKAEILGQSIELQNGRPTNKVRVAEGSFTANALSVLPINATMPRQEFLDKLADYRFQFCQKLVGKDVNLDGKVEVDELNLDPHYASLLVQVLYKAETGKELPGLLKQNIISDHDKNHDGKINFEELKETLKDMIAHPDNFTVPPQRLPVPQAPKDQTPTKPS